MNTLEMVREFHKAFGHPVNDKPFLIDGPMALLRMALIDEELMELSAALEDCDPMRTLDALCDIQYVLDGTFLALGFHRFKDAAMAEVHRSNMSKLGADGKPVVRADGKILKGPNYSPPDLARVLLEGREF